MVEKKKYFMESATTGIIFEAANRKEMEYFTNVLLAGRKLKFRKECDLFK